MPVLQASHSPALFEEVMISSHLLLPAGVQAFCLLSVKADTRLYICGLVSGSVVVE